MYRDNDRYRTFSRRAIFMFGSKFLLMSGLIGRMYYLQVIEGDRYKTLADENRISLKLLAPPGAGLSIGLAVPWRSISRTTEFY